MKNILKNPVYKNKRNVFLGMLGGLLVAIVISTTSAQSVSTSIGTDTTLGRHLTVNGNTTLGDAVGDTITVTGTPTFAAPATFNGNLVFGDAAADTVSFTATPTVTLAADKKITIDATTTDQTQTAGVLDMNIDVAATSVSGQDIAMSIQGDYTVYGQKITLTTAGADLGAATGHIGEAVYIVGKKSATSTGNLWGNAVFSQSSTNNDGSYIGYAVAFDDIMGGADFSGIADVRGMQAYIDRTSTTAGGSTNLIGVDLLVKNRGAGGTAASAAGVNVTLDVSTAVTTSAGYAISESGSGTVGDGLLVTGSVTDGVDVSHEDIVNAISIGANNVLSTGTINLKRADAGSITITAADDNSDADLKLDPGGTGALLLDIRQADLAVGSCTAGELAYDTVTTAELCFCKSTNSWSCISFTTAAGPTD